MNILLLGSGGREHALAYKIKQSKLVKKLYIAPGNAGTANEGTNVEINPNDFNAVGKFALENNIKMVVVGPEEPLVNGIYDYFKSHNELSKIAIIGPSSQGAQLEGSKQFAKEFMIKYNIPTARFLTVSKSNISEGEKFLETLKPPYVLKADGLAAGKGVIITSDIVEAKRTLRQMLDGMFGKAGDNIVIEEFLSGIEVSYFILTDGKSFVILPEAKDYKRIGDNDQGLNTGGMGSVSPVPFCDSKFTQKVVDKIIKPTIEGICKESIDYKGFIFIGLMNVNGEPYVIEYNCRMGDPESQSVMMRLKSDIVEMFKLTWQEKLHNYKVDIDPRTAISVVLASQGYPGNYAKGEAIEGLSSITESTVFHAGTKMSNDTILSNGGRVMAITSLGENISDARKKCYKSIEKINWKSKYYRTDIGNDLK
ncbi:MAG TPA: phosphoribosylamine--glycine ligase, partial [Salinivirgaceae bacterium]|nr:phosphoribosylamine--glycine ligase [Salinivirgaceae bacterium]